VSATTEVLPVSGELLPVPGRYELRGDRCVVALSGRLLGVPVLHGRLTATSGRVVVATDSADDQHRCELELRPASLRMGVPLLGKLLSGSRGLRAGEFPSLEFAADRVIFGPDSKLRLPGTVTVRGEERKLRLTGTLHYRDPERLVLWVRGRLGRVHVEAAAEFVR
jgi:polyisoprenoid-binding protein YceI